ncbi:MAG: hypothetical protein HF978_07400 [Desulfobacteraceae bacterium]|nr:hypothetical protein [Desulfobacteraceae bacterium]MBC2755356.1 hypothetical protein [Desulfobacteraceae bacterium]
MTPKISSYFMLIGIFCLLIVAGVEAGIKNIRPPEACNMLNSIGLPTLGWKIYGDNECGCSSRQMPLGSENPFKNVISYYVEGSGQTVNQIRLIVSVLNSDESKIAHAEFQKAAQFLIRKLTPKPLPENFSQAIANGGNQIFLADGFLFEVVRKEWTMNTDWETRQCYEIKLVIR